MFDLTKKKKKWQNQLEIGMYRSHCMQFSCYTSMLDLCRLVILIYVIINEFSYDINVTKIALILY